MTCQDASHAKWGVVILVLICSANALISAADSVYRCVIANPDGTKTTIFSASPCDPHADMLRIGGEAVRPIGKADPENEVAALLFSVEQDIRAGNPSEALQYLRHTLEILESQIEEQESSDGHYRYRSTDKISKKLANLSEDLAHSIYQASIIGCREGAKAVCGHMNVLQQLEPTFQRVELLKAQEAKMEEEKRRVKEENDKELERILAQQEAEKKKQERIENDCGEYKRWLDNADKGDTFVSPDEYAKIKKSYDACVRD